MIYPQQPTAFNGAIATLERINDLLKDSASYRVQEDILNYKANIRELIKESLPFLKKQQHDKLLRDWYKLQSYEITINDFSVSYDRELIEELDKLDLWLRKWLHKEKVTFWKHDKTKSGFEAVAENYGIKTD